MAVIRPQIVITNFFWSVAFLGSTGQRQYTEYSVRMDSEEAIGLLVFGTLIGAEPISKNLLVLTSRLGWIARTRESHQFLAN